MIMMENTQVLCSVYHVQNSSISTVLAKSLGWVTTTRTLNICIPAFTRALNVNL